MAEVMFVYPDIEKISRENVLIKNRPADSAHSSDCFKIFLPRLKAAVARDDFFVESGCGIKRASRARHIPEIELMKPHAVEFPWETALQFRIRRGRGLVIFFQISKRLNKRVCIFYLTLIKREVIFQKCIAKSLGSDQMIVIFWFVHSV